MIFLAFHNVNLKNTYKIDDDYIHLMNLFKKLDRLSGFSKKLNIIYKMKNFTRVLITSLFVKTI